MPDVRARLAQPENDISESSLPPLAQGVIHLYLALPEVSPTL